MNLASIAKLNTNFDLSQLPASRETGSNNKTFETMFQSALNQVSQTDQLQKQASTAALNYALGYSDNTNELALAQQKANIALQYTVQVRNRLIDAYKEIMNLQF